MPHRVEIKLPHAERHLAEDANALLAMVARRRNVHPDAIQAVRVVRRSLDARGKRFHWILQVHSWLHGEEVEPEAPRTPPKLPPPSPDVERVVVVGAGPAGLFAALTLAEAAVPVTLLERGKPVQARRHDLAKITRGLAIDADSNYCYGEGGAGTYSDGKLYTRSGKRREVDAVLRVLVAHGAPPDILVDARPHIGSNRLPMVVTALRETLEAAGVDYRFGARVEDLLRDGAELAGVRIATAAGAEEIRARHVVLATGHGARDVLRMLHRHGVALDPKPFAMGVRAEHPQPLIDRIQYGGEGRLDGLPPASYALTATVRDRGVYSFCMCPGGWIVPAMTEPGAIVVNGMSLSRRDSPFANSGLVVGVEPEDLVGKRGRDWGVATLGLEVPPTLETAGPLWGLDVQAALERRVWDAGLGLEREPRHRAPAQRVRDLVDGRVSADLPESSYRPGLTSAPLDEVLPAGIATRLRDAMPHFDRQMRGYLDADAVLVATESRTSCPVRIPRDRDSLQSPTLPGLYPTGEGAGYAGGIVSAAIDGTRAARACLQALAL